MEWPSFLRLNLLWALIGSRSPCCCCLWRSFFSITSIWWRQSTSTSPCFPSKLLRLQCWSHSSTVLIARLEFLAAKAFWKVQVLRPSRTRASSHSTWLQVSYTSYKFRGRERRSRLKSHWIACYRWYWPSRAIASPRRRPRSLWIRSFRSRTGTSAHSCSSHKWSCHRLSWGIRPAASCSRHTENWTRLPWYSSLGILGSLLKATAVQTWLCFELPLRVSD